MILDTVDPIDLSHLLGLAPFTADLDTAELPPDRRDDVRRGLCWLLSQNDEMFGHVLRRTGHSASDDDIADQRARLDALWRRTFTDWRTGPEPSALDQPPDLESLNQLLASGYHLMSLDLPAGTSVFDSPRGQQAIELSLDSVLNRLYDYSEEEAQIRQALRWMLHQEDESLARLLEQAEMIFPGPNIAERRRYLDLIWDRAFADWRIPEPWREDYDVVGIP